MIITAYLLLYIFGVVHTIKNRFFAKYVHDPGIAITVILVFNVPLLLTSAIVFDYLVMWPFLKIRKAYKSVKLRYTMWVAKKVVNKICKKAGINSRV